MVCGWREGLIRARGRFCTSYPAETTGGCCGDVGVLIRKPGSVLKERPTLDSIRRSMIEWSLPVSGTESDCGSQEQEGATGTAENDQLVAAAVSAGGCQGSHRAGGGGMPALLLALHAMVGHGACEDAPIYVAPCSSVIPTLFSRPCVGTKVSYSF